MVEGAARYVKPGVVGDMHDLHRKLCNVVVVVVVILKCDVLRKAILAVLARIRAIAEFEWQAPPMRSQLTIDPVGVSC
jgi:hypothetical protein